MAMDISEIRAKYDEGGYTCKMNIPKKVWDDHIFDEELSVRRNRELAKEHNDNVDAMQRDKNKMQAVLDKQLTDDVVEYIMAYYNLTEKQARTVQNFVYQEHHAFMSDYFGYIDTYADFAFMLVESKPTERTDD